MTVEPDTPYTQIRSASGVEKQTNPVKLDKEQEEGSKDLTQCRFHRHFSQYKTNVIALEHRPDDVGGDDWKFLVDYFSSPNYKVICEKNKLNKAKQVIRCGRKSFQAVSYDAIDPETQKEPNYQDLWRMTHTNSNGE
ncbi:hypothetical protein P8452_22314 [Trifolium repens]|nr:hypothetical protein P8452_22314 [Trifolium repens]